MNSDVLAAVESLIYNFAKQQAVNNGIDATAMRLIMGSVYARFQADCLDSIMMARIQIAPNEKKQAPKGDAANAAKLDKEKTGGAAK